MKGTDRRDLVNVTVIVTDHEIPSTVLDQLRDGPVSFKNSATDDLPNRVVGTVRGRECLRILLNETGKLQVEIRKGAAHAP